MPVHDWTRVLAGTFHDFHQAWIIELRNVLNGGLLPRPYYALAEQSAGQTGPDVLTLERQSDVETSRGDWSNGGPGGGCLAVAEHPPLVTINDEAEERQYARKQDHLVIHHASDDRAVAIIEIVSPGNKRSEQELDRLFLKMDSALQQGIHLLVIDLHPPGRNDPDGLHATFWQWAFGGTRYQGVPPRGTVSAYRAHPVMLAYAYAEPVDVGDRLPAMPLFLTPEWYINLPLEETYLRAYAGVPEHLKRELESAC